MAVFPHSEMFKAAGVSIHVICTGAGAGLQKMLWEVPGSSAYLSGASFPYRPEETVKTLGFTPDSFCSPDTAVDLACVAYQRAYSFGEKRPVGLGLTASVSSEREHRGDHRIHACVMSDDLVLSYSSVLKKGVGFEARASDGHVADAIGLSMIAQAIDPSWRDLHDGLGAMVDVRGVALERFYAHPFFAQSGSRLRSVPDNVVLYPGSYNPPHPGHIGVAKAVADKTLRPVVFHVTADGPHKAPLTVQDLLKRARMLRGHDRLFTRGDSLYLDKARRFPGVPIAMGADALLQMLDPKWGQPVLPMLYEFSQLGTRFYVTSRRVGGSLVSLDDVLRSSGASSLGDPDLLSHLFCQVDGSWDFSSTEERAKVAQK